MNKYTNQIYLMFTLHQSVFSYLLTYVLVNELAITPLFYLKCIDVYNAYVDSRDI